MNRIALLLVVFFVLPICADEDKPEKNIVDTLFKEIQKTKIIEKVQRINWPEVKKKVDSFAQSTTFPFPNTSEDQQAKSKSVLYGVDPQDAGRIRALLNRAQIENDFAKKTNILGNQAACLAPLAFFPLIRTVRSAGIFATGMSVAFKFIAHPYYPLYDMQMLAEAHRKALESK